jgi:hypothetical protein
MFSLRSLLNDSNNIAASLPSSAVAAWLAIQSTSASRLQQQRLSETSSGHNLQPSPPTSSPTQYISSSVLPPVNQLPIHSPSASPSASASSAPTALPPSLPASDDAQSWWQRRSPVDRVFMIVFGSYLALSILSSIVKRLVNDEDDDDDDDDDDHHSSSSNSKKRSK